MAEFTSKDVITKLRALKLDYIKHKIGADPATLPNHFAEFMGYATLLYDHYASTLKHYRETQARVIQEEYEVREKVNLKADKRSGLMTVTEVEQRVAVRLSKLRAQRDYLEVEVKGATLHINGCQSLMKTWGDEAKGIR